MKHIANRPGVPAAKSFGGAGLLSFAGAASNNETGRRKHSVSSRVSFVLKPMCNFYSFYHSLLII
jgi:hypothetical protein